MTPKTSGQATQSSTTMALNRQYLIAYNGVSFLLWATLLTRVTRTLYYYGVSDVYNIVGDFARNTQSLALLEVVHSLMGLVRAPVMTTGMQVASRLLLVWGVVNPFANGLYLGSSSFLNGNARNNQLAYTSMLGAWSVTECVRYLYFVLFLSNASNSGQVPSLLSWMRYNGFWVLYPVGIASEWWLVFQSLPMAETWNPLFAWLLRAVLVIYIPGLAFTLSVSKEVTDRR
ncbi:MAG: hypothetical protein Q9159_004870 [Coniocarpon cinnabarinum]